MASQVPNASPLTSAEATVLRLVDAGLSNSEIAVTLSITVATVKCHLHRTFYKLGARNRTRAAAQARAVDGFSPLPPLSRSRLSVDAGLGG